VEDNSGSPSGRAGAPGEIEQADAAFNSAARNLDDLRGASSSRSAHAFLDMTSAAEEVESRRARELARDELEQATDRFASGVADTVEVVQAQEVVASAEENYIASLNAHNLPRRASLARSARPRK